MFLKFKLSNQHHDEDKLKQKGKNVDSKQIEKQVTRLNYTEEGAQFNWKIAKIILKERKIEEERQCMARSEESVRLNLQNQLDQI